MNRIELFESIVGMHADAFFADYWGKQPLFVRGAVPDVEGLIAPDDLAGLACEIGASRLVGREEEAWFVEHGPFEEERFSELGETDWTLLVQEVDRYDPAVGGLLDRFRCFPNWRLDDIMISYAVPGGTVGAHVDQYDVFLIQAMGERRWEIGNTPLRNPAFVEGLELRILQEFVPDVVYDVEPGDLLYLPPMFAHHGIATSECLTISVGFRKPLVSDMVASYLGEMLTRIDADRQLGHILRAPVEAPGLLDFDTLESVRSVFRALCYDEQSIDDWFGRFVTTPQRGEPEFAEAVSADELREVLAAGGELRRTAISLSCYQPAPGDSANLYVGGERYAIPTGTARLAELLTGALPINAETLDDLVDNEGAIALLASLVSRGMLET